MAEKKLAAIDVMRLGVGKHADGGSLFLNVTSNGTRSWTYRYLSPVTGKTREMGLGCPPDVSLADAREKRDAARKLVKADKDPLEEQKAERAAKQAKATEAKGLMTFREAADAWFAKKRGEWDSAGYAPAVESGLRQYCFPKIGAKAVAEIDVDDVVSTLMQPHQSKKGPLWEIRHPTATRLRGMIEDILNWAIAAKKRSAANPARWDILQHLLQAPSTVHIVNHHAHMPVDEMPGFMTALRKRPSLSARLLEFTILTATRSSEARLAKWQEIDWDGRLWTIPRERMKGRKNKRKSHTVPLSTRALAILRELHDKRSGELIFPGWADGRALSDAACAKVLELMGRTETLHGFRGSFSSWRRNKMANEFSSELAELALAHTVGTDVERAYQHDKAVEARRPLMQAWCDYCTPPVTVVKVA